MMDRERQQDKAVPREAELRTATNRPAVPRREPWSTPATLLATVVVGVIGGTAFAMFHGARMPWERASLSEPVTRSPAPDVAAAPTPLYPIPPLAAAGDVSGTQSDAPFVLGERLAAPATASPATAPAADPETAWESLIPKDWDPMKALGALDFASMSDSDPRAMLALKQLQDAWRDAPVNPSVDGTAIRIAGFVVPLDNRRDEVGEFLLVPYFGACIHVPPPPSNQVIHVIPGKPIKGLRAMDAVWVGGTIAVSRADTAMGAASYRMAGVTVEKYSEPAEGARKP